MSCYLVVFSLGIEYSCGMERLSVQNEGFTKVNRVL